MILRKVHLLVAILAPLCAYTASAKGKEKPLIEYATGQGYGMAGCGLGSVVFGSKPGMIQIFATTTNGFFGSQTFGISSGTLNCESPASKTASFRQKLDHFVVGNRIQIENDIAKANGESLATLEKMANCNKGSLPKDLQQNYLKIFSDEANQNVSDKIYDVISSNTNCRV